MGRVPVAHEVDHALHLTLFDGTDSIQEVGHFVFIVAPIVLIYSIVAASGLVLITLRFLVGLKGLMRYLALKRL